MKSFSTGIRILGVLLSIALAILLREVLLLGFIGLLFGVWLSQPVGFLARKRVPRGAAVLLVLVAMLGLAAGGGALALPQLSAQFRSASVQVPGEVNQLEAWFLRVQKSDAVNQLPQGQKFARRLGDQLGSLIEAGAGAVVPAAKGIVGLLAAFVFIFVLGAFLAYQPDDYRAGLRRLVPPRNGREFDELYLRLGHGLRRWLTGILTSMLIMGAFTAVGLSIAGINDWLLLASVTWIGTFVPYVGAISSAIPGLLIAISQSTHHFFLACLVYLGVHLLEGYVVQPFIMKKAVEIKPAMLLFGQAMLYGLFGILGAIVAAPLMVCIQITVEVLYVERHLGRRGPHAAAAIRAA